MSKSIHGMTEALSVIGTLLIVSFVFMFSFTSENDARAGSLPDETTAKRQGDAEQGRKLFDGKGICYYCHGIDGYLDQHPQLNQETKAIIDHLKPKPANLRNLNSLKLMTDDERFRLLREGHLRTGMLPDTTAL